MNWRFIRLAACSLLASAASAEESPSAPVQEMNFMQLFEAGGMMMYPLTLLSVAAVVLILLYILTIRRNAVVSDRFMSTAESLIRKRDYVGLVGYCHRRNECMARITQKALEFLTKNQGATLAEVREVAETEGSRQAGLLSTRVTYLADIGSIAPLVGLLGTVVGIIKSFQQISLGGGGFEGARQMQLAGGVSEALIATAAGLVVGLPSLVFYSIFRGRVQKAVADLEAASAHLMAMLSAQFQRAAAGGRPVREVREDYGIPAMVPRGDERPDLHGI